MREAWIYPCEPGLAAAIERDLDELGYAPQRQAIDADPAAGDGRAPALVTVVAGAARRERAVELCAGVRGVEALERVPLVLVLDTAALEAGAPHDGDELLVAPWSLEELRARIGRASRRLGLAEEDEIIRVGSLELNVATYQVTIDGRPVDFTYMEYELLRFLVTHPNRVFSREVLLSRVWQYDFYGGTRTVDVHVRRVRAKLGAEHAARIRTVRSVGYRFER